MSPNIIPIVIITPRIVNLDLSIFIPSYKISSNYVTSIKSAIEFSHIIIFFL